MGTLGGLFVGRILMEMAEPSRTRPVDDTLEPIEPGAWAAWAAWARANAVSDAAEAEADTAVVPSDRAPGGIVPAPSRVAFGARR